MPAIATRQDEDEPHRTVTGGRWLAVGALLSTAFFAAQAVQASDGSARQVPERRQAAAQAEAPAPPDGLTVTRDAALIATAMTQTTSALTGSVFTSITTDGNPVGYSDVAAGGFPTHGSTFGILTTGDVNLFYTANGSGSSGASNNGGNVRGNTDFDVTIQRVDFNVPAGANCLSLDFRFYSEEYPEYVGSSYNDAFIAELDSSTWTTSGTTITAPNNFAFDPAGRVISINSIGATAMSVGNATGTTYDGASSSLTASTPVTPGAHSLYLSIFDMGDHSYDSAVVIDRIALGTVAAGACTTGATLLAAVFNDFDGDKKTDPTVFNAPSGLWYSRLSTTGATAAVGYGSTGYAPVGGDYDGDRKWDRAVTYNGFWFIQQSTTGTTFSLAFGGPGYIPVPRDYDGDGKTDIAVYHQPTGLWYVRNSSTGQTTSVGFGGPGYTPVPGTYDNDGKADPAVFHEATGLWFIRNSTTGTTTSFGFGGAGYTPVPRDYDGDAKTDPAVYHPPTGLWYVKYSTTGATTSVGYGGSAYFPAPGDYDGDGKTEVAVYHQPSGLWFMRNWTTGATTSLAFGSNVLEHVALSPAVPTVGSDSDGDGLLDVDEAYGTTGGLNLPGMGTHRLRKDILLEYDWFDESLECGSHTHRPTAAMVNAVSTAFAGGQITNPSGQSGVNMIHDYGQGGLFTGGTLVADADGVIAGGVNNADFVAIKNANFASNRNGYFHYVLLPHRYNTNSTSSGQAELPGDDLVVSLYCAVSTTNVANTIMHELGHNLNLQHGGDTSCNWKPNYNSVMNYKYQFPGVDNDCTPPGNGVLDYSRGTRLALNENSLNESAGICGGVAVDWNGSGTITNPVTYDLNRQGDLPTSTPDNSYCPATLSTLTDYNDWANIVFSGLTDPDGPVRIIDCDNPAPTSH